MRQLDTDALVIGAGPAGASAAIRLADLGWRVMLVEQTAFPRQKVCGECLGPASLELLDELGVGSKVTELAGPPIRRVGWAAGERTSVADMPACLDGRHAHGYAIGRDRLDTLLLERARAQGVRILQPARVRRVCGVVGHFDCACDWRHAGVSGERRPAHRDEFRVRAAVVIDAHGSWVRGPECDPVREDLGRDLPSRASDLFAFKTTFEGTALTPGLLPVLCLPGGYGGMVVSDRGRTTIACCIRRQTLRQWRARVGGPAGEVVETYLRNSSALVAAALRTACRSDPWQAIGPLRTGFHTRRPRGIVPIGNAAAEAHPLIGEGICMALQSAALLARLCTHRPKDLHASYIIGVQRAHAALCRKEFAARLRLAQIYTGIAMQPSLAAAAARAMKSWPQALTLGARLAGKARQAVLSVPPREALV